MIGRGLAAREAEVLRVLDVMHQTQIQPTLVGGYAVNAYSLLPRYSVDCDLVVQKRSLESLLRLLEEQLYAVDETLREELEGVESVRLTKRLGGGDVSVDLMAGGVRCRQTGAVWGEEEVRRRSKELRVAGVNGSVLSNVAAREALIAMKLHSGRDQDVRDVVMLSSGADWEMVRSLVDRGSKERVNLQLRSAAKTLGGKEFEGRLKAYFGLKQDAERRIRTALAQVNKFLLYAQEKEGT